MTKLTIAFPRYLLYAACMLGLLFCFTNPAQAQTHTVSGRVTDNQGQALAAVTISIKGQPKTFITDSEGRFSIADLPAGTVLVFTYVGMKSVEEQVKGAGTLQIAMEPDDNSLEKVVAVGYGTRKRRDLIGSVSTVRSDELEAVKGLTSVNQALQGRAAGVSVSTSSGMPGAPSTIRIRGVNSINAGSAPLYVIDGVPVYSSGGLEQSNATVSQDPLSLLNPSDIESIDILKDAAATAIYGSRASNGVIIITTKSGKGAHGRGGLRLDYSSGFSQLTRTPDQIGFANTSQWFQVADMALQNATGNPSAQLQPSDVLSKGKVPFSPLTRAEAEQVNSNWFDAALRTGSYQDINLSGTKSTESSNMFYSANYRKTKGVLNNNDLDMVSLRLNTDFSPVNNLTLGARLNGSYSNNNRVKTGYSGALGGGGGTVGAFESANRNALPWFPIYDENDPTGYWSAKAGNGAANNDRRLLRDNVAQYRFIGATSAQYDLPWVQGLSLRTELGVDFIQNNSAEWRNELITEDGKSHAFDRAGTLRQINYNLLANYSRTFGGIHNISAVAGVESNVSDLWIRNLEARTLNGNFPEIGNNPSEKITMESRLAGEDYLRSYFLRADYKLMNRYLLGASIRRDGSSKFAKDYRWGTFAALSAGWIISDEKFFEGLSNTISLLKLRGSFGQTGNNNIPNYTSYTTYLNTVNDHYGQVDDNPSGTEITNLGNQAITWEKTNSFDIGIDFGFLKNRINGSIAYFDKDVNDMLLRVSLPLSTGVGGNAVWANVGRMRNSGVEFNVSSVNIQSGKFSWTTNFNVAFLKNKVISLSPELDNGGKGIGYSTGTKAVAGKPLGTFFMADYAGIDPEHGVEMIWEIDVDKYNQTGETVKTGRKIAATQANVNLNRFLFEDKTVLPTYFGGMDNTLQYGQFDLDIFFTFSGGNYIYDYNLKRASYFHNGQTVLLADVNPANIWSPSNPNGIYPKQSYNSSYPGDNWDPTLDDPNHAGAKGYWDNDPSKKGNYNLEGQNHSRFLYKGDYLRLKNLALGYNLRTAGLNRAGIQNIRLFVQATNLLTITPYKGYDPEGKTWVDGTGIPNTRTLSAGASVQF